MKLQSIRTTDGQWLGFQFELPDPLMFGEPFDFPVKENIVFNVQSSRQLPDGTYEYRNPNYIVVAREVS